MQSEDIHPHSPSGNFLVDTLQEWKRARACFTSALDNLFMATTTLDLACEQSSTMSNLNDIAKVIDQARESFACDERRLLDIRVLSSKVRNRYVASINQLLPPEILCHVFSLLSSPSESSEASADYPTVLSSVCDLWRRLAIGTPSLWSHVVLRRPIHKSLENRLQIAKLHLARTCGVPFHLEFEGLPEMSKQEMKDAISLVTPHITSLRSLNYLISRDDHGRSILASWLTHGTPGTLTRLSVKAVSSGPGTRRCFPSGSYPSLAELLLPIQSLKLSAAYINWTCAAFSGLIDLEIDSIRSTSSPTATQLVGILNASPLLQSLKLCRVHIRSSQGAEPKLVKHMHLQKLHFELNPTSLERLFAILLPCSQQLDLHLVTDDDSTDAIDKVVSLLCSYWGQLSIPILCLEDTMFSHSAFKQILSTFQSTHTLVLREFYLRPPLAGASTGYSLETTAPVPSRLHTLEFIACAIVSEEAFRDMIPTVSVRKLRLIECRVGDHGNFRALVQEPDICARLASIVPDFRVE